MSQSPRSDSFLSAPQSSQSSPSQPSIPPTPQSQRGRSQFGRAAGPQLAFSPGEIYTQLDDRTIRALDAQDAATDAARRMEEERVQQDIYDAQQAEYAAYLERNPPSPLPDFSRPLPHPPGFRPLTDKEYAVAQRVENAGRPVHSTDVFCGNQEHAAHVDARRAQDAARVREFMLASNEAQKRVAAAKAAAKKGGQRKTSKKSKKKSKRNIRRYTRKSNKNKMQRRKSHRRN